MKFMVRSLSLSIGSPWFLLDPQQGEESGDEKAPIDREVPGCTFFFFFDKDLDHTLSNWNAGEINKHWDFCSL